MVGLAFSGGKDSWACLLLLEELNLLDQVVVLWVNTGKYYPELLETIERAKAKCPHFVEILTDREGQNSHLGLPSEIVPVDWSELGELVTAKKPTRIQSYLQCCLDNVSRPLMEKVKELGITHLIRGQRLDESHTSPSRDGDVVEGVTFLQPIETWSGERVRIFLRERLKPLPKHFNLGHTSMDCYDCTAYVAETADRVAYTKLNHPMLHTEYLRRQTALREALTAAMSVVGAKLTWE